MRPLGEREMKIKKDTIIHLTKNQREKLDDLWFIYGNYGSKHTMRNHKYIQAFLEHGRDLKEFYNPSTVLIRKVEEIIRKGG